MFLTFASTVGGWVFCICVSEYLWFSLGIIDVLMSSDVTTPTMISDHKKIKDESAKCILNCGVCEYAFPL